MGRAVDGRIRGGNPGATEVSDEPSNSGDSSTGLENTKMTDFVVDAASINSL